MSLQKAQLKKQLQSQFSQMKAELDVLKGRCSQLQKECSLKERSLNQIKQRIEEMDTDDKIVLSEHATLRYFERCLGYDLKFVEKTIITDELKNLVKMLGGSGTYPVGDFRVVMKNNTIMTIVKP